MRLSPLIGERRMQWYVCVEAAFETLIRSTAHGIPKSHSHHARVPSRRNRSILWEEAGRLTGQIDRRYLGDLERDVVEARIEYRNTRKQTQRMMQLASRQNCQVHLAQVFQ